ncbi:MAG: YgiQ family radical SAM protein [Myxococcota bacterium]
MTVKQFIPATTQDLVKNEILDSLDDFNPENTYLDIIFISGDAYVDHPSFGVPLLARYMENQGYKVGIIPQPDWQQKESVKILGRPRLFFGISAGNIDSMLHHYTANKKKRHNDPYSESGNHGKRPNRATIVYTSLVKSAYKGVKTVIGGIEASIRRFVHYDYWSNKIRRSILFDSKADYLIYGMAEKAILALSKYLEVQSEAQKNIVCQVRGVCQIIKKKDLACLKKVEFLPSYRQVKSDKEDYIKAYQIYSSANDSNSENSLVQKHGNRYLLANPAAKPLTTDEMDEIFQLPFIRKAHPMYKGDIPALRTVKWSIISHRGCYGGCSFCALGMHQGMIVQSRSKSSIVSEVKALILDPEFKGVISDIGGPTANMYGTYCKIDGKRRECKRESCLYPEICKNLFFGQNEMLKIWEELKKVSEINHVFVASGVRFDLALKDKRYLKQLLQGHVSGQMKVAPEHVCSHVLNLMHKPPIRVFNRFLKLFRKYGSKKLFLVPYMISSHPGSTLKDMKAVRSYLEHNNLALEQAQDFIPIPMTRSTVMFYSGIDPGSGKKVFVEKTARGKLKQRYSISSGKKRR